MIKADCIPANEHETIIEIVGGPNKYGQHTFFKYWIGTGHFTGPRGQIFVARLSEHKADKVIDRR